MIAAAPPVRSHHTAAYFFAGAAPSPAAWPTSTILRCSRSVGRVFEANALRSASEPPFASRSKSLMLSRWEVSSFWSTVRSRSAPLRTYP